MRSESETKRAAPSPPQHSGSAGRIAPARLAAAEKRGGAVLLTAAQAAREVFGVSERTFHVLRAEPWMPAPVLCGARMLRWVRAELEAAVVNMPRQVETAAEPAQLRRRRIEAMKSGRCA